MVQREIEDSGKEIAVTTLKQLGDYGKMKALIAIRDLVYDKDGTLSFRFSGSRKANTCTIHLNGSDLYDMTFYQGTSKLKFDNKTGTILVPDVKTVKKYTDLYNDQLGVTFTEFTGLKLSLSL